LIVRRIKALRERLRITSRPGKGRKAVSESTEKKQALSEKKPLKHAGPDKKKAFPSPRLKQKKKTPWKPSDFKISTLEGHTRFHDLGLPDPVMHAIADLGFRYCTPIQAEILPSTLQRNDATGRAQTGTGKTAAFLITAITWMLRHPVNGKRRNGTPRILIIAPTRELALQIEAEARDLSKYCPFTIMSVFGGMDYELQRKKLREKIIDIIVATPGRLLDYHRSHDVHLGKVEILVIDEADRMLDMGFIPDVRRIIHSTPPKSQRQTLLFSATLTSEVTRLASQWTRKPVVVEIEPEHVAVDTVNQIVYIVTLKEKYALLYNVIERQHLERVLVFCNRRDQTRRLADMLGQYGINCAFLSGEVPQRKRIRILESFKAGKIRVLVATDVAGRGIHVEGISHVINYTLPHDPEDYVHRIGRTGRAGLSGTSVSFACEEDSFFIPDIEEFTGQKLNCITPDDDWLTLPPKPRSAPRKKRRPGPQRAKSPSGKRRPNPRRNKGVPRSRGAGKSKEKVTKGVRKATKRR
jgi:ATP-dependent RNA helicase RhlB